MFWAPSDLYSWVLHSWPFKTSRQRRRSFLVFACQMGLRKGKRQNLRIAVRTCSGVLGKRLMSRFLLVPTRLISPFSRSGQRLMSRMWIAPEWAWLRMPGFLAVWCLDPPDLETLFDKHPRCRLKKCQARVMNEILVRMQSRSCSFLLCAGGADVKMVSALPTALHADQPDGAGHFFNRRRGHLSNRVSRSGGSKHGAKIKKS